MSDHLRLIRPDDLLVLDVHLSNLRPSEDGTALERIDAALPARLAFELAPQHVAERAYYDFAASQEPAGPAPVETQAAGPSRIVFSVPDDQATVPLTLAALLDWASLRPSLAPGALPPGTSVGPAPQAPGDADTFIEFPYRLMISPVGDVRWLHRTSPITRDGRTELWHTRPVPVHDGVPAEDHAAPLPLRALSVRPEPDVVTPSSMSLPDLQDLVTLTADFTSGTRGDARGRVVLPRRRRRAPDVRRPRGPPRAAAQARARR